MKYTQAVKLHKNWLLKKISHDTWEVQEEFVWLIHYENSGYFVRVPKGFQTNFGSIPRLLRVFFNPTKYLAYVLHDFLYGKDGAIIHDNYIEEVRVDYTRKDADNIMREAIKVEKSWIIERNSIYLGVRLFWFLHYER